MRKLRNRAIRELAQSHAGLKGRNQNWALNSVAQLGRHHLANQKVASSIPGQGPCLGCRFGPWSGCMHEGTDQHLSLIAMIFSFFLSLPSPLSRVNKRKKKSKPKNNQNQKPGLLKAKVHALNCSACYPLFTVGPSYTCMWVLHVWIQQNSDGQYPKRINK